MRKLTFLFLLVSGALTCAYAEETRQDEEESLSYVVRLYDDEEDFDDDLSCLCPSNGKPQKKAFECYAFFDEEKKEPFSINSQEEEEEEVLS